jgi:hypothetical protein
MAYLKKEIVGRISPKENVSFCGTSGKVAATDIAVSELVTRAGIAIQERNLEAGFMVIGTKDAHPDDRTPRIELQKRHKADLRIQLIARPEQLDLGDLDENMSVYDLLFLINIYMYRREIPTVLLQFPLMFTVT